MAKYRTRNYGSGRVKTYGVLAGGGPPPPFNPTDLGAKLITFLDAEEYIASADSSVITSLTNYGSGPDFTKAGSDDLLKESVNGQPLIEWTGSNQAYFASDAPIAALSSWTFYAIVRSTDGSARYFLDASDGNHAIIQGFDPTEWEYFSTPRTTLATIDTTNFQVIKCTVGDTSAGTWILGNVFSLGGSTFWYGEMNCLLAIDGGLSGGEEANTEAWLAARVAALNA